MARGDIFILDKSFDVIAIVDSYESFIWTDRFQQCGDFEFYSGVSDELLSVFALDSYIRINGSDRVMIIEQNKIESNAEDGAHMTVTGRSLEQILMRRIVQKTVSLIGNFQDKIHELINDNIISPEDSARTIPNFIFEESTDPAITSLTISAEYTGEELYSIIQSQCKEKRIGFKVTLNDQKQFVFSLFSGVDRSYDQDENDYVLFSPGNDNLASSSFVNTHANYKNVALVGGEGKSEDRVYELVGNATGLDRRETFVDAGDLAQTIQTEDGEETYTDEEYSEMLINRGKEELAKTIVGDGFEAEADTELRYKYGRDFNIGDIVQLANEYGNNLSARVSEIVFSYSPDGYKSYPTFTNTQEEV